MSIPEIKGIHPYANEFPMASEEELVELTSSIATIGLSTAIVLTPDGLVLDGRNRLEACKRAGVDPHFVTREGDDDDYKEFVIGINTTGRRESMTPQMAAASIALILGHDKRKNGRWSRQSSAIRGSSNISDGERLALTQSGVVLDVLGPAHLAEVRDGNASLNAKYEEARREKDRIENAERRKVEAAKAEEERETYAAEYFNNHPTAQEWLDTKPEGVFETARAAFAAYQEHDREARAQEEERRREEEQRKREHIDSLKRDANRLKAFLTGYGQAWDMREHPDRDHVLNMLDPAEKKRFISIEQEITWPTTKQ